jgi:hypothetical protein
MPSFFLLRKSGGRDTRGMDLGLGSPPHLYQILNLLKS